MAVRVREGKIEVEIDKDKISTFALEPDEAMKLGIELLRAAYAAKAR